MFEFVLHVAIMACLYGMLALSLNLQVGFAGLVNFGQIILFGAGTYGAALAFAGGFGPAAGLLPGVSRMRRAFPVEKPPRRSFVRCAHHSSPPNSTTAAFLVDK